MLALGVANGINLEKVWATTEEQVSEVRFTALSRPCETVASAVSLEARATIDVPYDDAVFANLSALPNKAPEIAYPEDDDL